MQSGAVAARWSRAAGRHGHWLAIAVALLACGSPSGDDAADELEPKRDASREPEEAAAGDGGGGRPDPVTDPDASSDAGRAGEPRPGDQDAAVVANDRDASPQDASNDGTVQEPGPDGSTDTPPRLKLDSVDVGYNHACAIDERQRLWCWGGNGLGQLGVNDDQDRAAPTRVGQTDDWQAVALGRFHSCGLRAGALYCWGASAFGQAGALADTVREPSVVPAPEGTWTAVTAGDWHSCALNDRGTVYCWGYNLLGRLGDGRGLGTDDDPEASVSTPIAVALARAATSIAAGAGHTCALDDLGAVWCWGGGERGQLGASAAEVCKLANADAPCSRSPQAFGSNARFVALSVGANHACAIDDAGGLWCWGADDYGQLGRADLPFSAAALGVAGTWSAVACGGYHTCALASEAGALACFGDHANGQLGFGSASSHTPVATGDGRSWLAVSSGTLGSCALDAARDAYCWGQTAYSQSSVPALVVIP
jgi:alpha-tubulin suppressor-like RCC1 family protein